MAALMWRQRLSRWIHSPTVERTIIALILINAVTLGLETEASMMEKYGQLIKLIDNTILGIFVIEIALRLIADGWRFFKNPWSLFDFTVVTIALVPATEQTSILRALRVLRVLRLVTMVPQMRRVVGALLSAIPGLLSIIMVLLLVFYVFAVIATNLFGGQYPEWFGSIGASMYTLFQIMTLESWSMGIVRPVMDTHAYAWAFFIPFILIATFTMLNLFIAIIVHAMQSQALDDNHDSNASQDSNNPAIEEQLREGISRIEIELQQLRQLVHSEKDGGKARDST